MSKGLRTRLRGLKRKAKISCLALSKRKFQINSVKVIKKRRTVRMTRKCNLKRGQLNPSRGVTAGRAQTQL